MSNTARHRPLTDSDKRRFWSKVSRCGEDACWLWNASVDRGGYGQFRLTTKGAKSMTLKAHRLAYELANGVTDGLLVCHRCDVPRCVNPSHLFLGTPRDNSADAIAKGRSVPPPPTHGTSCPASKLTPEDVCVIRTTNEKSTVLAARFGVTKSAIWRIRVGKNWKYEP